MSTFDTEVRMNVRAMVFIDGENLAMRPTLHIGRTAHQTFGE
jgi:hypothetical protein